MDALSATFNHALNYGILVVVPLGGRGKICHFLYAYDLIALSIRDDEGIKIIKLILYQFEGMFGLLINYHKPCLYTTK